LYLHRHRLKINSYTIGCMAALLIFIGSITPFVDYAKNTPHRPRLVPTPERGNDRVGLFIASYFTTNPGAVIPAWIHARLSCLSPCG